MLKRLAAFSIMGCLIMCFSVSAATWRVLFYMDAVEDLNDMAIKAITDMIRAKPEDSVELYIQLHAYHQVGLRYRVSATGLRFVEEVAIIGDSKKDIFNAASWAFTDSSDIDHTMLILSDHGWGILDPRWNALENRWEAGTDPLSNVCAMKRSLHVQERHRGYMFNVNPRSYLTNQDMVALLSDIQMNILGGRKLDVLAFDTCMGAMLEVAYQVAPYAYYLVGCQSCSLPDGFNYQGVIAALNASNNSPRTVVTGMVEAFNDYYSMHDTSGIYTHAALDLSYVSSVKEALEDAFFLLLYNVEFRPMLVQAQEDAPRFCLFPQYTDLISFCKSVEAWLLQEPALRGIVGVLVALQALYAISAECVVARCGSHRTMSS